MNAAASAELNTELPGRTEVREARHWIERQLKWERTLGTLRDHRSASREKRAA